MRFIQNKSFQQKKKLSESTIVITETFPTKNYRYCFCLASPHGFVYSALQIV